MVKDFYILRHGETDWNRDKRLQGQTDIPLNDQGREQAAKLAPVVHQLDIEVCYASPLARAYETAEIIMHGHPTRPAVISCPDIQERNFGFMNGMTADEIELDRVKNPHLYHDVDGTGRLYPKDCEAESIFRARVQGCVDAVMSRHDQAILLVSHGGTIRQIFRYLLKTHDIPSPSNCGLYRLQLSDCWQLVVIKD